MRRHPRWGVLITLVFPPAVTGVVVRPRQPNARPARALLGIFRIRLAVPVMSSGELKRKLKAARDAFDKKDFQSVHDNSLQILEYEPEHYMAYVPLCAAISRFDNLQ